MAPEQSLEDPRITRKGDPPFKISPPALKMVAARSKCPSRSETTPTQPCSSSVYRYLKRRLRLGHSFKRSNSMRDLVSTKKQVAYKQSGTKGSLFGPKRFPRSLFKQRCIHSNRQHHSCCLHKQGRRHEVGPT